MVKNRNTLNQSFSLKESAMKSSSVNTHAPRQFHIAPRQFHITVDPSPKEALNAIAAVEAKAAEKKWNGYLNRKPDFMAEALAAANIKWGWSR